MSIEGEWEAGEFATSLHALDRLYALRFGLALEAEDLRELRDLYVEAPYPPSPSYTRSLRRWARLAPASFFRAHEAFFSKSTSLPAASDMLEPQERLFVRRIIYGSPGIKDLAGIGEIVGHVKDLLVLLIEHYSTRQQRSLENERRQLENKQLQVEIAKEFVGLAQELGYTKKEMRQLVASVVLEQRPLVQLIAAGKITSADTIKGDPDS